MKTAEYWIERLEMQSHPEGGYFREMYRSDEKISKNALPSRYKGDRNFSTSIYFLLKQDQFSNFHRIKSDETWHFYQGDPLELYVINPDGGLNKNLLGPELDQKQYMQLTIPRGHWFGGKVKAGGSYTLVGCTVAPGFHFDDFEMGKRNKLTNLFPQHEHIIKELTQL